MARPSPSRQTPVNPYIAKNCSITVKLLEPDEISDNQTPKLTRIFPSINGKPTQYHLPEGYQIPLKSQEYYEFILVDSDSAEITHTPEPNSETIAYSKCKILKFITKEEWGNPYQARNFSQQYSPSQFNYFDYQEAWFKAFYLKPTNHSWFFNFCQKFNRKIPNWAHNWWVYFGLTKDILPEEIQHSWTYFQDNLKKPAYGNKAIMFSAEFQVPWILGWDFAVSNSLDHQYPPILERRFRIKWWKNFQSGERLLINNIRLWLITYDKLQQFPKPERSTASPSTGKHPNKKELKKKLLEELSQLGDSDNEEDIGSSQPDPTTMQFAQDPYEDYDII